MPKERDVNELKRIRRVADMMVTAHALMKEYYITRSLISDVCLFTCSLLLCAIAFADQVFLARHFGGNIVYALGLFSLVTFIFSFIASLLNWSVKSERHRFAFEQYNNIKFESKEILNGIRQGEAIDPSRFLEKYKCLTPTIIAIPEKFFLKCKRRHILKVYISKRLDDHPGTSLWLLRIKLWWRDNCRKIKNNGI